MKVKDVGPSKAKSKSKYDPFTLMFDNIELISVSVRGR